MSVPAEQGGPPGRPNIGPARFFGTLAAVALAIVLIKLAVVVLLAITEPRLPVWLPGLAVILLPAGLAGLATGMIVGRSLAASPVVTPRHALIAGLLVGGAVFAWDLVLERTLSGLGLPLSDWLIELLTAGSLCLAALPTAGWVLWVGLREDRFNDDGADRDLGPHIIVLAGMLALLGFFAVVSFATATAWVPERGYLETRAKIINIAGRQRMLSQRIGRYAAAANDAEGGKLAALRHSIRRLREEGQLLDGMGETLVGTSLKAAGNMPTLLQEVRERRSDLMEHADRLLVLAELRTGSAVGPRAAVQEASDELLEASERLVTALESDAAAAFKRTAMVTRNLGILLTFILIMGGMSVILPVAWIVRRQHHRLLAHAQMLAASRDETTRALRELEAYQTALDQRIIVAITDRKGIIEYANDRFCEISGYSREELVGRNHRIINSGRHPKQFFRDMWQTIARGHSWQGEICNSAKDGQPYWVDTTIVPMKDDAGRISRFLSIRYDVTGHRLAQQALRESEAHLKRAQAVAKVGSWSLDLTNGDLRWSEETHRMFGVAPGTPLTYELFLEIVHPEDREIVDEAWKHAIEGSSYSVEHRIIVDGNIRHVLERADFERDEAGRPLCATGTVQDVTERKRAEAQILWQARYDALSGLPNRRLFQECLEEALEHNRANGLRGAVIMIDLDHFKIINDTHGHSAGDKVLAEAAQRLKECVREEDLVGRFGGDEFLVLVRGIESRREASETAEKIQSALMKPFVVEGRQMILAASVGICVFPEDSVELEEILQYADAAMYDAKRAGRQSVRYFTPEMHRENLERVAITEDLRGAIERGELELHYQPIMEMPGARLDKCEALIRWRHPEKGLITPDRFIPIAQTFGLIAPIGEWVVLEAARQQHAWRAKGLDIQVSVNITADHLRFDGLTDRLIEIIRHWDVSDSIVLELTESLLINDEYNQFDRVRRIAENGIGIAIDDFGTGYSSLNYLARIPARYLKIDRTFTGKLDRERERRLVSAIIGIGHDLGMSVVAEGVETAEQVAFLMRKQCDYAQGYFFARPLPPDALLDFASRNVTGRTPAVAREARQARL